MGSPELQRWADAASKQHDRFRSLYSLIFGSGAFNYLVYRTRLQYANLVARSVLHVLEYFLIFHTMPAFLLPAMLLRLLVVAIESGWWGMMDAMRQRIRELHEKGGTQQVRQEIENWLAIAQRLALVVIFCFFIAIILMGTSASQSLLMFAMGGYLAVRLMLRTLYSGIYALRRIYVRLDWIIGAEIAVFLLAWTLKDVLGDWTLPFTIIVAGVLTSIISFHFIRSSLDFMKLTPRVIYYPLHLPSFVAQYQLRQLLLPALAMIIIRLHDIALILALQFLPATVAKTSLISFYLIMPTVRTALGWSQVLYFDMVRNQLDYFAHFRRYFERLGLLYSLPYALAIAVIAGLILWLTHEVGHAIPWQEVLLYIVLCSLLGVVHVSLFTREHYVTLLAITLLQYGLLFGLISMQFELAAALYFSVMPPFILGLIKIIFSGGRQYYSESSYLRWVVDTMKRSGPSHLLVLKLYDARSKRFKKILSEQYAEALPKHYKVTFYRDMMLCIGEASDSQNAQIQDTLLTLGAGHVIRIYSYDAMDGQSAIKLLNEKHGLPLSVTHPPISEITAYFRLLFPRGMVQIPTVRNNEIISALDKNESYFIVKNALAFAEGITNYSQSRWFVSALQHQGAIVAMFLVEKSETKEADRQQWIRYLNSQV